MSIVKKTFLLSSSALLAATMSIAQNVPSGGQSGMSAGQDSSAQAGSGTLRGCLSGSASNYTLTDDSGTIYHLTVAGSQLDKVVGHEVEVMGAPDTSRGSMADQGTHGANFVQVSRVRDVASKCSHGGSAAPESMAPDAGSPMNEKSPMDPRNPNGASGSAPTPQPHMMAALELMAQDPSSPASQNSNSASSMSSPSTDTSQASQGVNSAAQQPGTAAPSTTPSSKSANSPDQSTPPVSSQTPAASTSPTNPSSQMGQSPANSTGMSPADANNNAQAAQQGQTSTNPQTGQTTGRGVDNQGVNDPSQTSPSAVPNSTTSATPQAGATPQDDASKPLYERQATDIPYANRSGSTASTTSSTPPQNH